MEKNQYYVNCLVLLLNLLSLFFLICQTKNMLCYLCTLNNVDMVKLGIKVTSDFEYE